MLRTRTCLILLVLGAADAHAAPAPAPTGSAAATHPTFEDAELMHMRGDVAGAMPIYRACAENGDVRAMNALGACLKDGVGIAKDAAAAKSWFEKAVAAGYAPGHFNLGLMYEQGDLGPADAAKAFYHYRIAADAGVAEARHNLAQLYFDGTGTPRDERQGRIWLEKAASQDFPPAIHHMGVLHEEGRAGLAADVSKARDCYRRAAQFNHPDAAYALGRLCETGANANVEEAARWYAIAARGGLAEARFRLGMLHLEGRGVAPSTTFAENYLAQAASQGHADAMAQLGLLFEKRDSDGKDRARISDLYEKSAASGSAEGRFLLAMWLHSGKSGGAPQTGRVLDLLRQAAEQDHPNACHNLGALLSHGAPGISANDEEALRWLRKGAALGFARSRHNLALRHVEGRGVPADTTRARILYRQAANQGLPESQLNLALLLLDPAKGTPDPVEAMQWAYLASKQGDADADALFKRLKSTLPAKDVEAAELRVSEWLAKRRAQSHR